MIAIRKMTPDDLEAVTLLGLRSKASWGYRPSEMAVFSEELTLGIEDWERWSDALVAISEGQVSGYATLTVGEDAALELEHLFVDPDRFGQGIGRRLLEAALGSARERGFSEVRILSDPNACGFYLRFGAVLVREIDSSVPGRKIPLLSMAPGPKNETG